MPSTAEHLTVSFKTAITSHLIVKRKIIVLLSNLARANDGHVRWIQLLLLNISIDILRTSALSNIGKVLASFVCTSFNPLFKELTCSRRWNETIYILCLEWATCREFYLPIIQKIRSWLTLNVLVWHFEYLLCIPYITRGLSCWSLHFCFLAFITLRVRWISFLWISLIFKLIIFALLYCLIYKAIIFTFNCFWFNYLSQSCTNWKWFSLLNKASLIWWSEIRCTKELAQLYFLKFVILDIMIGKSSCCFLQNLMIITGLHFYHVCQRNLWINLMIHHSSTTWVIQMNSSISLPSRWNGRKNILVIFV